MTALPLDPAVMTSVHWHPNYRIDEPRAHVDSTSARVSIGPVTFYYHGTDFRGDGLQHENAPAKLHAILSDALAALTDAMREYVTSVDAALAAIDLDDDETEAS